MKESLCFKKKTMNEERFKIYTELFLSLRTTVHSLQSTIFFNYKSNCRLQTVDTNEVRKKKEFRNYELE